MIYDNTTVLDFETTGLNPVKDSIVEVAALRIRNGHVIGSLSYVVNPETEVPNEITAITGLTTDTVIHGPTMKELLPWLMSIIGDSLIVAHNALFDLSFLESANKKFRGKSVNNNFLDTRAVCIEKFPYESHRLDKMCERLDIRLDGAHRAMNDVNATWELLQALSRDVEIKQFVNKLYYFKKYGSPDWTPRYANVIGL